MHLPQTRLEWFSAMSLILWGTWLLLPGSTYSLSDRIYAGLANIASEEFWGLLATCFGAIHVVALLVNGNFYLTPTIRAMSAGVGSTIWLVLLITSVANGAGLAASMPLYAMLCLANWHILIMAGQDQRTALEKTSGVEAGDGARRG